MASSISKLPTTYEFRQPKTMLSKTFPLLIGLTFALLSTSAKKPNVLFILVDDMGWKDLTNEGSVFYESPNVDRIAKEGMKFTRGYATCQVCSPSRASILTGKYPTNHGITTWIGDRSGEAWRGTRRQDSHLPPEYERNLRASGACLLTSRMRPCVVCGLMSVPAGLARRFAAASAVCIYSCTYTGARSAPL